MRKMSLEEIDEIIEKLTPAEQLSIVIKICQRLSGLDLPVRHNGTVRSEKKQISKYLLEYPQ